VKGFPWNPIMCWKDLVMSYKHSKLINPSFKQFRPSVQLTEKDKLLKRSNLKQYIKKDIDNQLDKG
jgi:hypothetical protein